MTREELLQQTRFYKGETICPDILDTLGGIHALYWDYERVWVKAEAGEDDSFRFFYDEMVKHFKKHILKNKSPRTDVPLGLQAIFVNRMEHWGDGKTSFVALDRYIDKYLAAAKEYEGALGKSPKIE